MHVTFSAARQCWSLRALPGRVSVAVASSAGWPLVFLAASCRRSGRRLCCKRVIHNTLSLHNTVNSAATSGSTEQCNATEWEGWGRGRGEGGAWRSVWFLAVISDSISCRKHPTGAMPKSIAGNLAETLAIGKGILMKIVQSNLAISNSDNSKSPLFRSRADSSSFDRHLMLTRLFRNPLFQTYFHVPWDFGIAGFDCIKNLFSNPRNDSRRSPRCIMRGRPMWVDDIVCLKRCSALLQFDFSNFKTKRVLLQHPHVDVMQKTGADELVSRRVRARRRPQRSAAIAGGSAAGGLECPAG